MTDMIAAGTTAFLTVDLTDKDGAPDDPIAAYVTVLNRYPPEVIRAEAAVASPAASMEIIVTPAENELVKSGAYSEIRHVKLRAVFGVADEFVTSFEYKVRNAD